MLYIGTRPRTNEKTMVFSPSQLGPNEPNTSKKRRIPCQMVDEKEINAQKKRTQECIYWPLVKELFNPRTEQLRAIVQFRPEKVNKMLEQKGFRYMWYQNTINLAEDIVHGPFDWQGNPLLYTIARENWEALQTRGSDNKIDVGNINRISQLLTSNKQQKKDTNS